MTWWMWLLLILFIGAMANGSEERKKKEEADQENERRRREAEDYILNSGDPEAIKTLMLARANPAIYNNSSGNPQNVKTQKENPEREIQRRRKEAEDYILSSGDPNAIKMLMLARANPANYNQILSGGMNKGSETLKTALGVMAGVTAGNLVANAISASTITNTLDNMNTDLASFDTDDADDFDTDIDFDF